MTINLSEIEEKKKKRFQFLHKLYDLSGGTTNKLINRQSIGDSLAFDTVLTTEIVSYLRDEKLIECKRANGDINLSHKGVREVEDALSNPNKPTTYFPAINVIMNSTITNSQIQQSNNGQNQTIVNESYNELNNILQIIKDSSDKINISIQQKSELDAKIQEIKNEIASKNPNKSVISKGVDSIKRILEGIASNVIASGLLTMLAKSATG